jgi:hypothetical protein
MHLALINECGCDEEQVERAENYQSVAWGNTIMTIQRKNLNQNNSGYGYKQMRHAWEANLSLLSRLQEKYNLGAYDHVIRDAIESIKGMRIRSTADLDKMNEGDLARFYFLGRSYLAMGQANNAVACFHIVYSQHGFEKKMLSGPIDFAGLVSRAGAELEDIARERGEIYVNNIQVDDFMGRELKGGCFIATAVYISPSAPEVLIFRRFRDDVLLHSKIGSFFVKVYYFVSPPLASLISRASLLKRAIRYWILTPFLWLLRNRKDANTKKL